MRKLLFMVLAVAVLAGCSKEDSTVLSEGDKITRSIKQIDTPLMEVLKSIPYWGEIAAYTYTEPDGKGEEILVWDHDYRYSGSEDYAFHSDGKVIKYIGGSKDFWGWHHFDYDIIAEEDNTFTIMRNSEKYYLKVLAYDETKIWVETDCYDPDKVLYRKEFGRVNKYPYVRMLLISAPDGEGYFDYSTCPSEDEMYDEKWSFCWATDYWKNHE